MGVACHAFEIPLLSSLLYLLGWAERAPLGAQTPWEGGRSSAKRRDRCGLADPAGESLGPPRGGSKPVLGRPSGRPSYSLRDPIRGHCQAGSLTGAVHPSKNNVGVLRPAQ